MSPLRLRRYRAERLLHRDFEALRERVLASVRGRLAASGARLADDDLHDAYSQAFRSDINNARCACRVGITW